MHVRLRFLQETMLFGQLAQQWGGGHPPPEGEGDAADPSCRWWLLGAVVAGRGKQVFTLGTQLLRAMRGGVRVFARDPSSLERMADPSFDWAPWLPAPPAAAIRRRK